MSKPSDTQGITVTILDKEYLIACTDEERHELMRSAEYLDKKMREIRETGKVVGSDRIAVMAALNISHELLTREGGGGETVDPAFHQRLRGLEAKIEDALYKSRQLEI